MTARSVRVAVLLIVIGLSDAVGALQERAAGGGIRLMFPGGVDLAGLSISYFLNGSFGGFGSFVRTKSDVREYVIETSRDGRPAETIKGIVYCPGHQLVLFTRAIRADQSNEPVAIALEPLPSVSVAGRIIGVADPSRLSIEVEYRATWSHAFFGIVDGAVTSFTVAATTLKPDGSFIITMPALARDATVVSQPASVRGRLLLVARERATGNIPYSLELEGRAGTSAELPIAPAYPEELTLVAVNAR